MNKKIIAAFLLIILVIVGYLFFRNKNSSSNLSTNFESNQKSEPKSLKELITSSVAQKCTFSSDVGGSKNEGSFYISNNKMRGDFTTMVSGKSIMSHMIVDNNTSYLWSDDQKTGYKMSFDMSSQDTVDSEAEDYTMFGVNPNTDINYECDSWVADQSVFQIPSTINFIEFNLPSAAPQSGSSNQGSSQCSYCDSLTGDSKTQCLTALNCK